MAWYDDIKDVMGWDSIKGAFGYDNVVDAGQAVGRAGKAIGRAFQAPYEQKAKGYDAIRAEVDRLKGVRQGQKDYAYKLADSKFEPARKALDAVYGDPKSWKL